MYAQILGALCRWVMCRFFRVNKFIKFITFPIDTFIYKVVIIIKQLTCFKGQCAYLHTNPQMGVWAF
jgi:hypothetical protein